MDFSFPSEIQEGPCYNAREIARTMNILLTFLSLAGALVGTSPLAHADFETIIVLYEPTFTHPLCDELMSKHLQDPTLKVEAYAYAAPTGVDFNPY